MALLPDETPVGDLPLRRHTISALRTGGVLTLGELRAMADRELLLLRRFGRGALADVRSLVPAPGAGSVGDEVTIAGRAFTLGAVYAPRRGRVTATAPPPAAGLQRRQPAAGRQGDGRARCPRARERSWPGRVGGLGGRAGRGRLRGR